MTVITKDLMRHAKRLVARNWARDDDAAFAENRTEGHCVATACVDASTALFGSEKCLSISSDAVLLFKHANGIDPKSSVGDWNDAPERTNAEVLAAFDKAIDAAAEQVPQALRGPRKPRAPGDAA